jgi:ribosomal protein L16 Arg81 hydroxylase
VNSISTLVGVSNYNKFIECWMNNYCFIESEENRGISFFEQDFRNILSMTYRHIKYPDIRLVKNGSTLNEEDITSLIHTEKYGAVRRISVEKIWNNYELGATIVLNSINHLNDTLFRLSNSLSFDFGCDVKINAYYSPEKASGFDVHYDTHDVLILQIYGKKIWHLSPPTFQNPLPEHHFSKVESPRNLPNKLTTNEGDILYIPRGMWHCANTEDDPSLHLTIGIHSKNYYKIIEKVLSLLKEYPPLRAGMPINFDDTKITNEVYSEILPKIKSVLCKYVTIK